MHNLIAQDDKMIVESLPEEVRNFKSFLSELIFRVYLSRAEGREEFNPVDDVEQRHILGVLRELNGMVQSY